MCLSLNIMIFLKELKIIFWDSVSIPNIIKLQRKKLVVISDKAVRPTNIMGASKRFAEMIVQSENESKQDTILHGKIR